MDVDYAKFPQIPAGCKLNYNNKTGAYQVYRNAWVKGVDGRKGRIVRETVGIIKNGEFIINANYQLRQQVEQLQKELEQARMPEQNKVIHEQAKVVAETITQAVSNAKMETRKSKEILIPLHYLAIICLMASLTGKTDATSIAEYAKTHIDFFKKIFPDFHPEHISHDSVRKLFFMVDPSSFDHFFKSLVGQLAREGRRVLAADGQAVRATARRSRQDPDLHGVRMLMNVYDTNSRVCVGQKLIDAKTNEIFAGPELLRGINIDKCIVTADAMSCQHDFAQAVLRGGGDFLISLKSNQILTWNDVRSLFSSVDESHVFSHEDGWELDHGRIEKRKIDVIPGRFLSESIKKKWELDSGSVVRIRRSRIIKASDQESFEEAFYITSLRPSAEGAKAIGSIVRSHWGVENRLHWLLDMFWHQDRMQANNGTYIQNRSALNKMGLGLLENYRFWLEASRQIRSVDDISIQSMQIRCGKPEFAIECLAAALAPKLLAEAL